MGFVRHLVADVELPSLSLGMKLEMRTLARSAGLCQTHSSMEMHYFPRLPLGDPLIRTVHHHRLSRTNRT